MSVIPVESCTVSVIDGRVQAFRGRHYTNYGVSGDFGFFGRPTNRAEVTVDSDTSYADFFRFFPSNVPVTGRTGGVWFDRYRGYGSIGHRITRVRRFIRFCRFTNFRPKSPPSKVHRRIRSTEISVFQRPNAL